VQADAAEGEVIVVDYGNAVFDPLGPRARMLSTMAQMVAGDALQFYSAETPPVPVPPPTAINTATPAAAAGAAAHSVSVASIERVRADAAAVRVALNLTYALAQPPYRVSIFPLIRPPFVPLGDFPLVFKVKLSGDAGKAVAAAVSSPSKPSRQRFLWVQAPSRCGSGAAILGNTLSTTYDHVGPPTIMWCHVTGVQRQLPLCPKQRHM
jgi:hypothetical protein